MIQAGYYTLKTLEGISNGYVCLTYMGNQLEVRIRIDRALHDNCEYKGYFTVPFATVPQDPCVLTLTTGKNGAACMGVGTIAVQNLPDKQKGVAFTIFSQNRPCLTAQIVLPEPIHEPESVPKSEELPETEPEMKPETEPETEHQANFDTSSELASRAAPKPKKPAFSLQEFDPFNTTNNAYCWWICTNTDDFYQLMEDSGIVPDPPLYTALSSALGRFGHFLFGQYQETEFENRRTLLIFGVPVSGSTPVPSQNSARWIPAQNKIADNSNYAGYWLYYFDAETKHNVRAKLRA